MELLQQQMSLLMEQLQKLNETSDLNVNRMNRMNDYEKIQQNFLHLQQGVAAAVATQRPPGEHPGGPGGRTMHLIDPKELAVTAFQ